MKTTKTCLNGINTLGFGHWCAVCHLANKCDIFQNNTQCNPHIFNIRSYMFVSCVRCGLIVSTSGLNSIANKIINETTIISNNSNI